MAASDLRASFVENAGSDFPRRRLISGSSAADLTAVVLTPGKDLAVGRQHHRVMRSARQLRHSFPGYVHRYERGDGSLWRRGEEGEGEDGRGGGWRGGG